MNFKWNLSKKLTIACFLLSTCVAIMVLATSTLTAVDYQNYQNIHLKIYDFSPQKDNPSAKVIIDGKEVYQVDKIAKSEHQNTQIHLSKGVHTVVVSTIANEHKQTTTVNVVDYPKDYYFNIVYKNSAGTGKEFIPLSLGDINQVPSELMLD